MHSMHIGIMSMKWLKLLFYHLTLEKVLFYQIFVILISRLLILQ